MDVVRGFLLLFILLLVFFRVCAGCSDVCHFCSHFLVVVACLISAGLLPAMPSVPYCGFILNVSGSPAAWRRVGICTDVLAANVPRRDDGAFWAGVAERYARFKLDVCCVHCFSGCCLPAFALYVAMPAASPYGTGACSSIWLLYCLLLLRFGRFWFDGLTVSFSGSSSFVYGTLAWLFVQRPAAAARRSCWWCPSAAFCPHPPCPHYYARFVFYLVSVVCVVLGRFAFGHGLGALCRSGATYLLAIPCHSPATLRLRTTGSLTVLFSPCLTGWFNIYHAVSSS